MGSSFGGAGVGVEKWAGASLLLVLNKCSEQH